MNTKEKLEEKSSNEKNTTKESLKEEEKKNSSTMGLTIVGCTSDTSLSELNPSKSSISTLPELDFMSSGFASPFAQSDHTRSITTTFGPAQPTQTQIYPTSSIYQYLPPPNLNFASSLQTLSEYGTELDTAYGAQDSQQSSNDYSFLRSNLPTWYSPTLTSPFNEGSNWINGYDNFESASFSMPLSRSTGLFAMYIEVQPSSYQITNYNIHPPPVIRFSIPLEEPRTITATLIEKEKMYTVNSGFQSDSTREAQKNSTTVIFSGLKLSKKAPIKQELQQQYIKSKEEIYFIRFTVGEYICDSNPFQLLSSYSQLPAEARDRDRPVRKVKKEEEQQEERMLEEFRAKYKASASTRSKFAKPSSSSDLQSSKDTTQ